MTEVSITEILILALALGLFAISIAIGWYIGFKHAKLVHARDRERMDAFKENASRDLDWLRRQADDIIRICGAITKHADNAKDTIRSAKAKPVESVPDDHDAQ